MIHDFGIVWSERGLLLSGLANTAILSAFSAIGALLLGAALAPALMARHRAVSWAARGFVDGMRCVPFLLFAYIVYYGFPSFGVRLDNWTTGLAALTLYNAAYMAEILRGAWIVQPREPLEAGVAFGFSGIGLFRRIILPPLHLHRRLHQILQHREVWPQGKMLEHHPDPGPDLRQIAVAHHGAAGVDADPGSIQVDLHGVGLFEPVDAAQQRRLARA